MITVFPAPIDSGGMPNPKIYNNTIVEGTGGSMNVQEADRIGKFIGFGSCAGEHMWDTKDDASEALNKHIKRWKLFNYKIKN